MNIFVIPAWYPNSTNPIAGCFIKEQVRYYAQLNPIDTTIVSVSGNGEYVLRIKTPFKTLRALLKYKSARGFNEAQHGNLYEWFRPVLEWSDNFGGNLKGIVSSHWDNYNLALRRFKHIDIIHAHVSYPAGWVAMEISRRSGCPFVVTEHMGPFPFDTHKFIQDGRLTNWIKMPLLTANAITAVSSSLASRIKSFGLPQPIIIPNIIDEQLFTIDNNHKSKSDNFTFLTVGAIQPEKGIRDLLFAAQLTVRNDSKCRFWIVGDGPYLAEYKQLAMDLGLDNHVTWLGCVSREKMPTLMQSCDAFVLPSHHETFGVVYAEANACGKPVIATRCGGPEDYISSINGILVEIGDIEGIANAMIAIRKDLGQFEAPVIRNDFLRKFSRSAVVPKIRSLYQDVIGKSSEKICAA